MKQMKLFSEKVVTEFGGSLSQKSGKRKVARPLVFSKPMHLVLKTSKAKGKYAFSPTDQRIKNLIQKMGQRFGVKIYSVAQNWSHIHLVFRLPNRVASNSMWRLDEAGDFSVDPGAISVWSVAHNEAYIRTLEKELGLEIGFTRDVMDQDQLPRVYEVLNSVAGRTAISEWNQRNSKTP